MTLIKWKNDRINTPAIFNDFFEDFFNRDVSSMLRQSASRLPAVNIAETKDGYRLEMALPGWRQDNVKINLDGNLLEISGEMESKAENEESQYTRREFSRSSFNRTFTLPETVDGERIEAEFNDGVLNITLPMREEMKKRGPKTIEIGNKSSAKQVRGESSPSQSQAQSQSQSSKK